jgi:predicted choloylglycine hydrolase
MKEKDNLELNEKYKFINLSGTNYEVGYQLAQKLKSNISHYPNIVTKKKFNPSKTGYKSINDILEFIETFYHGFEEELEGLSDGFDEPKEKIAFAKYIVPDKKPNICSQFVVLPSITKNNSIYVGRSYDYHPDDEDLILLKTKVNKKFGHIGFSLQGFGRAEGLNSKGLVVSMTGGGAFEAPTTKFRSFNYSLAIRILLETCKTVDKAVELLLEMPTYSSTIYLIADTTGKAALIESIDSKHSVKFIEKDSEEQFLVSTNHYNHPEMANYNKYVNDWIKPNSKKRYEIMNSRISSKIPYITENTVERILAQEFPKGVCSLYYAEWFGTLWTMLFENTKKKVKVCYGPPSHNQFYEYYLDKPTLDADYKVRLPNKFSADSG